jgi:hypothetical protein
LLLQAPAGMQPRNITARDSRHGCEITSNQRPPT